MGMLTRSVVLLEMKRLSSAGYNSSEAQLEIVRQSHLQTNHQKVKCWTCI